MPRSKPSVLRACVVWKQKTTTNPTQGTNGQRIASYTPKGNYRGEVTPIGGDQTVNSTQLVPVRRFQIRIRYGPLIAAMAAQDQLVYQSRILTVTSVFKEDEQNFWLIITAEEQPGSAPGGP